MTARRTDRIWLSWEHHRRSESLSAALGYSLHVEHHHHRPALIRYALSAFGTLKTLFKYKPKLVVAQNPSVFLCVLLGALKPVLAFRLVMDAHNHALQQRSANTLLGKLDRFAFKQTDVVIVTNQIAAQRVSDLHWVIMNDPVAPVSRPSNTDISALQAKKLLPRQYFTLVSSFADDEPTVEVINAIQRLPDELPLKLCITGKRAKAPADALAMESERIVFTDYLSDEDFDQLLRHSAAIIDLTTRPDCLVYGFSEALAVGVPILLSDNLVSRDTYGEAAFYTKNDADSICAAICQFCEDINANHDAMPEHASRYQSNWQLRFDASKATLEAEL